MINAIGIGLVKFIRRKWIYIWKQLNAGAPVDKLYRASIEAFGGSDESRYFWHTRLSRRTRNTAAESISITCYYTNKARRRTLSLRRGIAPFTYSPAEIMACAGSLAPLHASQADYKRARNVICSLSVKRKTKRPTFFMASLLFSAASTVLHCSFKRRVSHCSTLYTLRTAEKEKNLSEPIKQLGFCKQLLAAYRPKLTGPILESEYNCSYKNYAKLCC